MEQVEAWREAEELERRFGSCMAAWRAAMNASTSIGGHPSPERVPDFDVRWVTDQMSADGSGQALYGGQAHLYWQLPGRVLEPRLNGTYYAPYRSAPSTIQPTVLSVASERPECGFRLATMREMADLYYEQDEAARLERDRRPRRGVRAI